MHGRIHLRNKSIFYKTHQVEDMPLILRCVPVINDFDLCICSTSLKTSTKVIGLVALVSIMNVVRSGLRWQMLCSNKVSIALLIHLFAGFVLRQMDFFVRSSLW